MKISIITATYNSAASIKDCLSSVNNQTFQSIEHIIVDGLSTDNTLEIIRNTPNRISIIISEPDKGIYDAMNKGIRLATGDVIGFVHSDDALASVDTLRKVEDAFIQTGAHGVYGDLVFVNGNGEVVRKWKSKPFKHKNVGVGWMPAHPTLFLKKEVYEKHGLFDTNFKIAGDYDFMLRVMLDKEINLVFLPEVITKMRMGGVSTGNLKDIITKSKEDIRVLRKNGFKFPLAILAAKNLRKLPQLFIK